MEPFRWQPPADRADSKLKTAKKKDHTPPLLQSYRTHHSRAPEKKTCTAPPPTPGQHSNKSYRTHHSRAPEKNLYSPATHPRLALK
jgi:hypothetical protein